MHGILCMQCGYEHKAKCTSHCMYTFEYNSTCVHWYIAQSLIASMRSENVLASAHVPRHTGVMLRISVQRKYQFLNLQAEFKYL